MARVVRLGPEGVSGLAGATVAAAWRRFLAGVLRLGDALLTGSTGDGGLSLCAKPLDEDDGLVNV